MLEWQSAAMKLRALDERVQAFLLESAGASIGERIHFGFEVCEWRHSFLMGCGTRDFLIGCGVWFCKDTLFRDLCTLFGGAWMLDWLVTQALARVS